MQLEVIDPQAGGNKGTIDVAEAVFGKEYNEALIHQVVTAYLAENRAGTRAQKNRSAVRGGGAKPWRQKGTGRARAGTIRSPIWRKGGVTFAAQPKSYAQKVNKKMYRGALRSILSELLRQGRLRILENFTVNEPKTKQLQAQLTKLEISHALIVIDAVDDNLYRASRNIPNINVCTAELVNPLDLIKYQQVFITAVALKKIEEQLK